LKRSFWTIDLGQVLILALVLVLGWVVWQLNADYAAYRAQTVATYQSALGSALRYSTATWADGHTERLPILTPDPSWPLQLKGVSLDLDQNGEMWMRVDLFPLPSDPMERKQHRGTYDTNYFQYVFLSLDDQGNLKTLIAHGFPSYDRAKPAVPPVDLSPVFASDKPIRYYHIALEDTLGAWPEPDAVIETKAKSMPDGKTVTLYQVDRGKSEFYRKLKAAFRASTA